MLRVRAGKFGQDPVLGFRARRKGFGIGLSGYRSRLEPCVDIELVRGGVCWMIHVLVSLWDDLFWGCGFEEKLRNNLFHKDLKR